MTDLQSVHRECELIALYISRGDTSVAQRKINKLVSEHPAIAGNIRLNITNLLLDIITNGKEVTDEEAADSQEPGSEEREQLLR